jgi:hypothetical protein
MSTADLTAAWGVAGAVCGTAALMFAIMAVFVDVAIAGRSGVLLDAALPHSSATNMVVKVTAVFILGPAGTQDEHNQNSRTSGSKNQLV